jgi:hypothetical protein
MSDIRALIEQAKNEIEEHNDPHIANYILRDTQEVKNAGLSELSWAMHKNYCVANDVYGLIELLEKWLDGSDNVTYRKEEEE